MKGYQYIGDGVYARWDGYAIWICTSNGIDKSQDICLEEDVLINLMQVYKDSKAGRVAHATKEPQDE